MATLKRLYLTHEPFMTKKGLASRPFYCPVLMNHIHTAAVFLMLRLFGLMFLIPSQRIVGIVQIVPISLLFVESTTETTVEEMDGWMDVLH